MNQDINMLALSLCPDLDWDRDKTNWVRGFEVGYAEAMKQLKQNDMDIVEMIDKASEKFGEENYERITNVHEYVTASDLKTGFTAGVEWATTDPDMLMSLLKPFAEWCDAYFQGEADMQKALTKFITETIKQKQDGQPEKGN